jgi:MerR family transcriptional regulator, copper efflux regulator
MTRKDSEGLGLMSDMGIGELARRAGVRIDTVRYYERHRLLLPRERRASGYRRYGELEVARLRFIRRAKALGFSLAEVRELLALSSRREVSQVKRRAQVKLVQVEERLAELERIRNGLAELISACPGHGRASDCPILQALGYEEDEQAQ